MVSTSNLQVVRFAVVIGLALTFAACAQCSASEKETVPLVNENPGPSDGCFGTGRSSTCSHPPVEAKCGDGWCFIPHGCFVMGSPECEWGRARNAEGENETTLTNDFYMKETEVTQAEWTRVGLANPSLPDAGDCDAPQCPVGNVSWYSALSFANKLSEIENRPTCYALSDCTTDEHGGLVCGNARSTEKSLYDCAGYRLPTEAEWEYAARAGTRSATYAGDLRVQENLTECRTDPVLEQIAWYCGNSSSRTHEVKQKRPNNWGLYDMAGNAREPVSDDYRGSGYGAEARTNPGSEMGGNLTTVHRGGFMLGPPSFHRSAYRFQFPKSAHSASFGFRLVRTAK